MRALIAGATGFIGRKLVDELLEGGWYVSCLVREPQDDEARELAAAGCEIWPGDLIQPHTLEGSCEGIDVVYYLAHLMSGTEDEDLVAREEEASRALAREAKRAGVAQLIYLGGLGDETVSVHLEARNRTAQALREEGPPMTYFRAAMVVGGESESYVLLKSLVERLPAIPDLPWLQNRTQPIGVDDVVEYLVEAPSLPATRGREIQLGGPEAMTYEQMLEGMAQALGTDPPVALPAPRNLSAKSVGRAAGSVTRGDPEVAEYLTAGLASDTVVTDPSGVELFDIEPEDYELTLARAIEEEARAIEEEDE